LGFCPGLDTLLTSPPAGLDCVAMDRPTGDGRDGTSPGTRVTVIMPVRNEAAFISRSLGAVLAQDYPQELTEVLVVDGMSTDGTRDVVREFRGEHPQLHLMDNPAGIVAPGLNLALRASRGEIIIRVDGHCEIAPDYVRRCVQHLEQDDVDGVGGPWETVGTTPQGNAIALAVSSPFGVGGAAFRTVHDRSMLVDTVGFPAYTRRAVERAGAYDEELVRDQDDEYNSRLRKLGARILLSPDIRARYYSRSSFRSLWRQYFQYGYWKVRVLQKHPRQMRARHFVPAAFLLALFGAGLLAVFDPVGWTLLAVIAAAYMVANLGASVWTAARSGWRYFPSVSLAYAILHVSYGLGFLVGLARFANRWLDKEGRVPPLHRAETKPALTARSNQSPDGGLS
jgi:succinoglycan biosynthesis protein ExoA